MLSKETPQSGAAISCDECQQAYESKVRQSVAG
jgi:hypothetical protein